MSTHEPTMTGTKVCTKCNKELPVICFAVCKNVKGGLHNECRDCARNRSKDIYKNKNKDRSWITTTHLQVKYQSEGISYPKKKDE